MNPRIVAVLAVIVFGIVASAVWFLQSKPSVTPLAVAPTPSVIRSTTPDGDPSTSIAPVLQPGMNTKPLVTKKNPAKMQQQPAEQEEWEVRIDQVLSSNAENLQTAQMLINLLPTFPEDGRVSAIGHITNLIEDKDYNKIMPLLKNPALGEAVQDEIVTDLMGRDDPIKLPALLEVAKMPNHPYHEEAITDLQVFLDEDNGENWTKWDTSIKTYLKKQAQEEAEAEAAERMPAAGAKKVR